MGQPFIVEELRVEVKPGSCRRGPQAKACGSDGVTRNTQGCKVNKEKQSQREQSEPWASAHGHYLLEGEFSAEKTAVSDKLDLQNCIRDRFFQALSNVQMGGNVPAVDLGQNIPCLKSHLAGGTVG